MQKNKRSRTPTLVVHLIGLTIAVGLLGAAVYYQQRLLPGVRIGQIAVGGLTLEQAERRVQDALGSQRITLTYRGRSWQPTYRELGVSYRVDQAVGAAFAYGRSPRGVGAWLARRPVSLPYERSEQLLSGYLEQITQEVGAFPKDALVHIANGQFVVDLEQAGTVVPVAEIHQRLTPLLAQAKQARIAFELVSAAPKITAADLSGALDDAGTILGRTVALKVGEREYRIERQQLMEWLLFVPVDPKSREVSSLAPVSGRTVSVALQLKDDALRSYLERVAAETAVPPEPQELLLSANKVQVLKPGKPGKQLVLNDALDAVRSHVLVNNGTPLDLPLVEVPAPTRYVDPPPAPQPTGKAIAVDLTKQIEYDYEDGVLVYSTYISSGIHDWTPTGTFKIYAKTKKQKMSGPGYYVPNVPWILWFKGDYSIHGVYWHNDFGIRPRSHGCVGEPLDAAEWIYNWAEVGTPVVIYKS